MFLNSKKYPPAKYINDLLKKHDQFGTFSRWAKNAENPPTEELRYRINRKKEEDASKVLEQSFSPIFGNDQIHPTLIKTKEISDLGPSEVEDEFWSVSKSGDEIGGPEEHLSKETPSVSQERAGQRIAFNNKLWVNNISSNELFFEHESHRSDSNVYKSLASERKVGVVVPVFKTKMIGDISKKHSLQKN